MVLSGMRVTCAADVYLSTSTSLKALKVHPYLKGFAGHLMPRQGDIDRDLTLAQVGRLMPWHGFVHPEEIVDSLNRLIKDEMGGKRVFFSFYEEPTFAAQTGLFFFRGKPGAPFAVVCPGGGFAYVGSLHEGFPLAQAISQRGLNAFVIQYRLGGARRACEDLAQALVWIADHARALGVAKDDYSLWGGSAGARMAAYLGSYGTPTFGARSVVKPAAVIMAYTGHTDYTDHDPPTYAIVSRNDPIADADTMRKRLIRLAALGIPTRFHLCRYAGHGFGLGTGSGAQGWVDEAVDFWIEQIKGKGNENKDSRQGS